MAVKSFPKTKKRNAWAFLQKQWLISPETTGWMGGVHAPVRVLQAYMMLAAKMTTYYPLARGIHYAALLREPTSRFLSEFYETYDGWEARFNTPPHLDARAACSTRLPTVSLHKRALHGIDNVSKKLYDQLFPFWIRCSANAAANRQTRALAYNSYQASNAAKHGINTGVGVAYSNTSTLAQRLCSSLPNGLYDTGCSLQLARRALYQLSFVGLNEQRCATEKLFEAQFSGLRFDAGRHRAAILKTASRGLPTQKGEGGAKLGQGAHKVAKLAFDGLSADEQRRVRFLNRDDLMLYAEAKRLFNDRLQAYGIPRDVKCS